MIIINPDWKSIRKWRQIESPISFISNICPVTDLSRRDMHKQMQN